jgi:serine/threonine protein kinase/Tfp pilus assembly protein PilF
MTGKTIGQYSIIEKLGEGGMGVVYKAHDDKLDRIVALKFLPHHQTVNEAEQARFLQEARAAATLNHSHVCTIFDIKEEAGQQFIVMEYVDGMTLRERIGSSPLKPGEAMTYAVQIGEALQEAHSNGIVHRDVKAENIMVNTKNQVKVMDFGLAKLKGSLRLTKESSTVGTLAYMAPEQIQAGEVDARSDIFSFGVLLFEMTTGRLPFRGEHDAAMMYSILNEEPESLNRDDLPADLQRIIHRAIEKDPDDRYQHVDDMVSELKLLQKKSGRVSRPSSLNVSASLPQRTSTDAETITGVSSKRPKRRWLVIGGVAVGVLVAGGVVFSLLTSRPDDRITSMAVLPFTNGSTDPNAEYLSDGFTESLINSLSRLPGIKMMSRSSVFRYKGKEISPQTAAHELGVGAVLTGRIAERGNELAISVELINGKDNSHIWGEQYYRPMSDIISLQSEISREISSQLKVTLTGEQESKLTRSATENTEAYQLYLKGRFHWNKRTAEGFQRAADYYRQAIEKDPSFALAYAGLADTYVLMHSYFILPPAEAVEKATAAAQRALALDPQLGQAHIVLAGIKGEYEWDWEMAEREYRRGVELDPNYATGHQWYGEFLVEIGRIDEGLREIHLAQDLDPLSPIIYVPEAYTRFATGEFDAAEKQIQKSLEIDPRFPRALSLLGQIRFAQGKSDEGIKLVQQALEYGDSSAEYIGLLGYMHGMLGQAGQSEMILEHLQRLSRHEYVSPYLFAIVYTGLGRKDEAFRWLNRGIEAHDYGVLGMLVDPVFESLRTDPRFEECLQRIGFPQ